MRRFFRKTDWIVIAVILTLAAAGLGVRFFAAGQAREAVISYQGQEKMHIDLRTAEKGTFSLPEVPQVIFMTDGQGGIAVAQSDCPDQICVKAGWLRRAGDFAACVPNGITVHIVGTGGVDTVARP